MRRGLVLTAVLFLLLTGQESTSRAQFGCGPREDCLSQAAFVEGVEMEVGKGVMRLHLTGNVDNPALCDRGNCLLGNCNEVDIPLVVSGEGAEPPEPANSPLRTFGRRTSSRSDEDEDEDESEAESVSAVPKAESMEREEIRLLVDTVFLASMSKRRVRVLVDGRRCSDTGETSFPSGDPRILPVAKGIIVEQ